VRRLDEKELERLRRQFQEHYRLAQQKPADDGFEPISELPPDERLPAAPMLVAAYAFVVLALFGYLVSIGRRLGAVKQEIARLEADVKRSARP
jgi:CcmD family protein